MKTLVIGGTGTVGTEVVKELVKKEQQVRVLTTSTSKAITLPQGVETHIGDLNQPENLSKAFEGIDTVFMLNMHTLNEINQAGNAIAAAKEAGIDKMVYQSIHRAHEYQEIPHVKSKAVIEEFIRNSGIRYTFVCPNNFYQNDFRFKDAITQYGVYPQPIGQKGLSRNDVRDIAEVAVKALLSSELDGLSIPIVGPDVLNGVDTANLLSECLGFKVCFGGDDLVSWAANTKQFVPEWMVDDWTIMYRQFQERGLAASDDELTLLTRILGRAPRSYRLFLEEHKGFFQQTPALV